MGTSPIFRERAGTLSARMQKVQEVPISCRFARLHAQRVATRPEKAYDTETGSQIPCLGILEIVPAISFCLGRIRRVDSCGYDPEGLEQLGELAIGDWLALGVGRPGALFIRA